MHFDLHTHTNQSICSNLSPKDLLQAAQIKGLDGIAVTDHNQLRGALEVKRLNKDKDFKVIIGEEVTTDCGHVLCYFLKERIPKGSFTGVIRNAINQGAIVAIAHPYDFFRIRANISMIKRHIKDIHAIETINGRCLNPIMNDLAHRMAVKLGLAELGGSDGHFTYEIGAAITRFRGTLQSAVRKRSTHPEGSTIRGLFGLGHTALNAAYAQLR